MKNIYFLLLSTISLLLVNDAEAQLKLGDQPTSVQKSVILDLQGSNGRQGVWLPRISDTTNATGIDGLNPPDGVLIYHTPSSQLMIRANGFWQALVPTTGIYSINHNSQSADGPNINFELGTAAGGSKDFNISMVPGQDRIIFNLPDAAGDTRGVVSIASQTFSGLKTFNNGLISSSTTTVSGSSSNASNLYLGITSATSPGASTDRYLSVDGSGRVILSSIGVINNVGIIGSSPNANGATLSAGTLTLQPASAAFGGVVTTTAQTFAGAKTFNNVVSAKVNLQAGTAAAGTAPLKFTSGTNLAVVENGAVEYDGSNYYATSGGIRYTLAKTLTATATLDFPSTGGFGTSNILTITVNGASDGDAVILGIPAAAMAIDGTYTAYVSSANTVSIVFTNNTWGTINPGSGTFRVSVLKY